MGDFLRAEWIIAETEPTDDASAIARYVDGVASIDGARETAAFSVSPGGELMQALAPRRRRLPGPPFERYPDWLVLTEIGSLDDGFRIDAEVRSVQGALLSDLGLTAPNRALYRELAVAHGPDWGVERGTFAPVVQFGRFSMPTPEEEWWVHDWYERERIPDFRRTSGAIRARRWVCVSGGYARFAVLYEFTSYEARMANFETVLEAKAHDAARATAADRTVHEQASSCVGVRVTG
jgi:hypothetical protein